MREKVREATVGHIILRLFKENNAYKVQSSSAKP